MKDNVATQNEDNYLPEFFVQKLSFVEGGRRRGLYLLITVIGMISAEIK